jgi:hypothetical protein
VHPDGVANSFKPTNEINDDNSSVSAGGLVDDAPLDVASTTNIYGIDTEKLVDIALSQVGYEEGKYWNNDNNEWEYTNDNKYGEWFGWNNVFWCAIFIDWCINQAGISPELIPNNTASQFNNGEGINCASTSVYQKWYSERSRYQNISDIKGEDRLAPHEGDIVIFGDSDHIGIVIAYDENTGIVYTVEGNSSQQVRLNHYDLKTTTYITESA